MRKNVRSDIAQTALWGVAHRANSFYTEGDNRLFSLHRPFMLPFYADCSAAFEDWYCWNNAPSPAGLSGTVYTGTELTTGKHIELFRKRGKEQKVNNCLPADGVVWGPYPGVHIAMIVALRPDGNHLCVSHGEQGDPQLITISDLTEAIANAGETALPITYLRFNTWTTHEETEHEFVTRTIKDALA
jgi:hypothetical protein